MMYMRFFQLAIAALLVCVSRGEDGAETIVTETAEPKISYLLEGVLLSDPVMVVKAIADGEDIDVVNVNGWSAAMFAVAKGDLPILNILIAAKINLNQLNYEGVSPLMTAAAQGDKEIVEALLHANANPSLVSDNNETAYSLAVGSGRQLVALIIAESTVVRRLHLGDEEHSSFIVDSVKDGAYVNIQSHTGWTPLIYASSRGHAKEAEELLKLGASIHHVEADGWNSLHFACHNKFVDVVDLLLKNGIDLDRKSKAGETARDVAVREKFAEGIALIDAFIASQEAEL